MVNGEILFTIQVLRNKLNYSTDLRVTDESKIMGDVKDASESSISSSLNYDE